MVENTILVNQKHQIRYIKFGTKPHVLIALHGFGNNAAIFKVLEPVLGEYFTVLAVDLPFHGKTDWQSDSYTKQDMIDVLHQLLEKEQIHRFSLMGYSLGAKIAMVLFPHFQKRLDAFFLIAPDGLSQKWYYRPMLFPKFFRLAVLRLLNPPQKAMALVETLRKYKFIDAFSYKFVNAQLRSEERCKRMLGTWVALSDFVPSANATKKAIISSNVSTFLICGAFDDVIDCKICNRFADQTLNIMVLVIPSNHFLLNEDLNEHLTPILKSVALPPLLPKV